MNKPGLQLHVVLYCSSQVGAARPPSTALCVCGVGPLRPRREGHRTRTAPVLDSPFPAARHDHHTGAVLIARS